ncbi:MAG: DNA-formamidopyrimidine glycosylase [Methylococcus sp.]|nr:MAG: DNA-formamidopyrimidine glycosylase [Methylococcus sp.]
MPELPEVETTRRGIEPHILKLVIKAVVIRQPRLRWPVPDSLKTVLPGQRFTEVGRRGKYLLLRTRTGTLIIHLGMSGSLRLVGDNSQFCKHDHVDIVFAEGLCLRYHDPRRFGCLLWTPDDPNNHSLIASMGPEPFSDDFNGEYLYKTARNRGSSIKAFLMDSRVVAGIGNIYANEALFLSGIDPRRRAGKISRSRLQALCTAIEGVLENSIRQGGTTLRDFVNESGQPGYFQQTLSIYNKEGQPCPRCRLPIRKCRTNQRSTFYCGHCQR